MIYVVSILLTVFIVAVAVLVGRSITMAEFCYVLLTCTLIDLAVARWVK